MPSQSTPGRMSDEAQVRLEITFPAEVNRISEVVERVAAVAREQLDSGKDMEVALALTEALANAVRHGCKNDPKKHVHLRATVNADGGLAIVVRDEGEGFDPASIPDPRLAEGLAADHGRGLHMIRQLMDEVRFERNGTELHMRKR